MYTLELSKDEAAAVWIAVGAFLMTIQDDMDVAVLLANVERRLYELCNTT